MRHLTSCHARFHIAFSAALLACAAPAWSVGTAFSYQGLLEDAGTPAANYDFEVYLFGAASGGVPIAGPFAFDDVPLDDGRFLLEIDAGNSAFPGESRWLELRVRRGSETGSYTQLLPRQPLLATPYAQHAGDADFAAQVAPGSIGTPELVDGAVTAAKVDANSVQRRVAGVCAVGQAMRVVFDDGSVACEQLPGAGTFWALGGNTGTDPALDFLGTTDPVALELRVNGERGLRLEPADGLAINVIAGFPGNEAAVPGLSGVTIFGGFAGALNSVGASLATVSGGGGNAANGFASVVSGGAANFALGESSVVAGGTSNTAGPGSSIGGGSSNNGNGSDSSIAGGRSNTADGEASSIGGGLENLAAEIYTTVAGGSTNRAISAFGTVTGGVENTAAGIASSVGGGVNNVAGSFAVVGGGAGNAALGNGSVVAGGGSNCAGADGSFAIGFGAKVRPGVDPGEGTCSGLASYPGGNGDSGSFVWSDGVAGGVTSSGPFQFVVQATGGVWFGAAGALVDLPPDRFINTHTGAHLTAGGAWTNSSDRNAKAGIERIEPADMLAGVLALPIYAWHYRAEGDARRHLGPMAQDFHAAFGLNGDDDTTITTVDADGVALAAIQGLHAHFSAQLDLLRAENAALRADLDALRTQLRAAAGRSTPQ